MTLTTLRFAIGLRPLISQSTRRLYSVFTSLASSHPQELDVKTYRPDIIFIGESVESVKLALDKVTNQANQLPKLEEEPLRGYVKIDGKNVIATLVAHEPHDIALDAYNRADIRVILMNDIIDLLQKDHFQRLAQFPDTIVDLADISENELPSMKMLTQKMFKKRPPILSTPSQLSSTLDKCLASFTPEEAINRRLEIAKDETKSNLILRRGQREDANTQLELLERDLVQYQKDTFSGFDAKGISSEEIKAEESSFKQFFNTQFPFGSLFLRIDNVASLTRQYVNEQFLKALDMRLAYGAGLIRSMESYSSGQVDQLLPKVKPFVTAQIQNRIDQAGEDASLAPLKGMDLVDVVQKRRQELCSPGGPTDKLERSAQHMVSQTLGFSVLSGTLGVASYIIGGFTPFASAGLGLFGIVAVIYFRQKKWASMSERFSRDLDRVMSSLQDELLVRMRECSALAMKKSLIAIHDIRQVVQKESDQDLAESKASTSIKKEES